MSDLNTSPDAGEAPEAPVFNPADFTPKPEPAKTYGSDGHGLEEAARDLTERRAKAEPPIKKWRLGDDAPKNMSARDAAARINFSRKMERAADLHARTGWQPEFAGAVTKELTEHEHEPTVIEYADGRPKNQPTTAREAAAELVRYRTETAPAEAQAREEKLRALAELVGPDLAAQTLGETPEQRPEQPIERQAEPAQPEQPDPIAHVSSGDRAIARPHARRASR